jgi:hypothetical protein
VESAKLGGAYAPNSFFSHAACGSDAKEQCGINQLCAGLEAGIEGGIYACLQTLVSMQSGGRMGISSH